MGLIGNILEQIVKEQSERTGVKMEFLHTQPRVIESAAQAKYHDALRAEHGYIQGVHKANSRTDE